MAGDPAKNPEPAKEPGKDVGPPTQGATIGDSTEPSNPPKKKPKDPLTAVFVSILAITVLGVAIASVVHGVRREDAPQPEPTYTGPAWEAYVEGRDFGRANQNATLPPGKGRKANTLEEELYEAANGQANDRSKDMQDALSADRANAEWWCEKNMPSSLRARYLEDWEALVGGCVGGALPVFDHPYLYVRSTP
ncbi:hypothetical protein BGK67_25090 [Streptomyces subrutilus]|uniref:Uncharacterized protein n=2 Tax=Streptomyces subrutilus TaxID=36818 RepID=A0A1E5PX63_9ACTN|nr:hypothetical protein BGK67_25090 [Streptomyces subrutilus]